MPGWWRRHPFHAGFACWIVGTSLGLQSAARLGTSPTSGGTYWNGKGGGGVRLHPLLPLVFLLLRWWEGELHQPGPLKNQRNFRNKSVNTSWFSWVLITSSFWALSQPHFNPGEYLICTELLACADETWHHRVQEAAIQQKDSLFSCLNGLSKEEDGSESQYG